MKVLVTGGAGYIGSTICTALAEKGHTPIILDSLVTGNPEFVREFEFYNSDIAEPDILKKIKNAHPDLDVIIHCAARIIVPESVENPFLYYKENVSKSIELFKAAAKHEITKIIFSSSASVYGNVSDFKATEDTPTNPQSPYAMTKLMMENVLKDFSEAYGLKSVSLRYFNPIGTDLKHRTGPFVKNPSHILGKLIATAQERESEFKICGTNFPTRDGTGIRDYIHVWDVAEAHIAAIDYAISLPDATHDIINIGTGDGTTVKEFVESFEKAFGSQINKINADPRPGDIAGVYASCEKAKTSLKWNSKLSIDRAISDALIWMNVK